MQVTSLTKRTLNKLPELQVSNKVVNTEGKLYIYDHKDKWQYLRELLKIYYRQTDGYLADKINVVSQLLANKNIINMPELILPTSLVAVDKNIVGFSMPFIENNVNMTLFLNNPRVNLEQKIKYLKEILELLQKITKIKELEGNFYLGDIHEANFILDLDEQIIKAVDMDSSFINNSKISISKYLIHNKNLLDNPEKYPHQNDLIIPNNNTTILCFIYMLLNSLSGMNNSYSCIIKILSKIVINFKYTYLHIF